MESQTPSSILPCYYDEDLEITFIQDGKDSMPLIYSTCSELQTRTKTAAEAEADDEDPSPEEPFNDSPPTSDDDKDDSTLEE